MACTPTGIAAVVVTHNSADDIPRCLEALTEAQGVGTIVVVDNASGDGSAAIVRRVGSHHVSLIEEPTNLGFAGGCNRGLQALGADPEWVAFLNPDVVVTPDCLARCAEALEREPSVAAVAPRLMRDDGLTVDSLGQVLGRWTLEVRDRGYGGRMGPELERRRPVLAACGALGVFRRSALARVSHGSGPWAEQFFCFWEDLELGWRLNNEDWTVLAIPDAVATHTRGAGAAPGRGPLRWRRPPHLEACILTNRWMTLIRHLHPLDLIERLPLLLVWDLTLLSAGAARRPQLLNHVRRRWPKVIEEWRQRRGRRHRRLGELPW